MRWRLPDLKTRYDVIGAVILVTGLLWALCIFIGADDIADSAQSALGADLDESGNCLRVLENCGEKANVLAHEMTLWFLGLWHGKNLAFTIAFLAIIVSFWFFFVDYFSDADAESERAKPGLPRKPRHR